MAELGIEPLAWTLEERRYHSWLRKFEGKEVQAGRFDLEIVMLQRFGILPYEGALYDQDPAFIDELNDFLRALGDQERKNAPKK